jgi:uncharacterized membrane protein YeiB
MSDARFTPVAVNERITTLDVIRGVALLGIFLMNIEWFNRPIAELDLGLPQGVTGIDYWAGWFVHVFVRSKFWTMFSLLFGMGFAVMLSRAQRRGGRSSGPTCGARSRWPCSASCTACWCGTATSSSTMRWARPSC